MKIKWCVIGAGGIADRRTIPAILSDKQNELVALMDKNLPVATALGEKYGVKSFSDEREMLKSVQCDAVYIGTPVFCHYEQALTALEFGKHVFVEKPIAMNADLGKKMLEAFEKEGKQLTIGYMMKYHNLHKLATEMVFGGKIGRVNDIRAQFSCWYPEIEGAWRQKKGLGGGGAIMDLAVHAIELIENVTGDTIEEVKSFYSTRTFTYEVEDGGVIIFKTKGGILGHIDVNFNIPDNASESKFELYGDKGYIICTGTLGQEEKGKLSYLYAPQGNYEATQNRVSIEPSYYYGEEGNLYLKQIKNFTKILRSKKPCYENAKRAVHVQELVDEIYNQK
jgi:predicted dehydrogenase